jgi:Na+/proline symporter
MGPQAMTTDDEKLRRKIRTNAIVLGLVAFGFFVAFIVLTALKG